MLEQMFGWYFSENSRRLWLFQGSVRGFPRKTPGKSRENCWKNFPGAPNATNSRISGTGKGKPAANLGSTRPGPCPHLPCKHIKRQQSTNMTFKGASDKVYLKEYFEAKHLGEQGNRRGKLDRTKVIEMLCDRIDKLGFFEIDSSSLLEFF